MTLEPDLFWIFIKHKFQSARSWVLVKCLINSKKHTNWKLLRICLCKKPLTTWNLSNYNNFRFASFFSIWTEQQPFSFHFWHFSRIKYKNWKEGGGGARPLNHDSLLELFEKSWSGRADLNGKCPLYKCTIQHNTRRLFPIVKPPRRDAIPLLHRRRSAIEW